MSDRLLLFLEKMAVVATKRTRFFGMIDPSTLTDAQKRLIQAYKMALLMMLGGFLLIVLMPNVGALLPGLVFLVMGWKAAKKTGGILDLELSSHLQNISPYSPNASALPSGNGPWVVYSYDLSGNENILARFDAEEDANRFAKTAQKSADKDKQETGHYIGVKYSLEQRTRS